MGSAEQQLYTVMTTLVRSYDRDLAIEAMMNVLATLIASRASTLEEAELSADQLVGAVRESWQHGGKA